MCNHRQSRRHCLLDYLWCNGASIVVLKGQWKNIDKINLITVITIKVKA